MIYNLKYKTFPIVVHCPGMQEVDLWNKLVKFTLGKTAKNVTLDSNFTIFTWNNSNEVSVLEKSLSVLGVPIVVLGREVPVWTNPQKLKLTCEFLSHVKTDFVMGVDSRDVIFLDNPNIVFERYKELFGCDLLFNCGPIPFPPVQRSFVQFEEQVGNNHVFKRLNGGVWVGKTKFCREFFEDCSEVRWKDVDPENVWWDRSEQFYIKSCFEKYFPQVQLDYESKIFQIIHPLFSSDEILFFYNKML